MIAGTRRTSACRARNMPPPRLPRREAQEHRRGTYGGTRWGFPGARPPFCARACAPCATHRSAWHHAGGAVGSGRRRTGPRPRPRRDARARARRRRGSRARWGRRLARRSRRRGRRARGPLRRRARTGARRAWTGAPRASRTAPVPLAADAGGAGRPLVPDRGCRVAVAGAVDGLHRQRPSAGRGGPGRGGVDLVRSLRQAPLEFGIPMADARRRVRMTVCRAAGHGTGARSRERPAARPRPAGTRPPGAVGGRIPARFRRTPRPAVPTGAGGRAARPPGRRGSRAGPPAATRARTAAWRRWSW